MALQSPRMQLKLPNRAKVVFRTGRCLITDISARDRKRLAVKVRRARVDVAKVSDLWMELPIGNEWTVAYRLVIQKDGELVVGELRVFPSEPTFSSRSPGTWSGDFKGIAAVVPRHGLRGGIMKAIKPSVVTQQLDAVLASARTQHPGMESLWPKWKGAPLGVRNRMTPHRKAGVGRKPHSELFLATIAQQYVEALTSGLSNPVGRVAQIHDNKVATVRGWIYQSRERGFLVGAREQGRARGALSERAQSVLSEHTATAKQTTERRGRK
jgi:hypothetical protein